MGDPGVARSARPEGLRLFPGRRRPDQVPARLLGQAQLSAPAWTIGKMKTDSKPRVYDILARTFMQEGVRTCFALLGDANMNWAARLAEQGCRMVYVRHEHCALAAAMAFARKNGDVGVATVTCGPGVTQLVT